MSGIINGKGHNRSVRVTKGQNVRRTIRVMILEGSRLSKRSIMVRIEEG